MEKESRKTVSPSFEVRRMKGKERERHRTAKKKTSEKEKNSKEKTNSGAKPFAFTSKGFGSVSQQAISTRKAPQGKDVRNGVKNSTVLTL